MSTATVPKRTARDIIVRPLITEKSMEQTAFNKYTFKVDPKANKTEIRTAVEEIFKVTVQAVHTVSMKGKPVRRGKYWGYKSDWKKAVVTLKPGDKIEIGGVSYFEQ
ncbi:MAG: 50S ribosomal protein L23 [Candidatus Xenobia bacterium]